MAETYKQPAGLPIAPNKPITPVSSATPTASTQPAKTQSQSSVVTSSAPVTTPPPVTPATPTAPQGGALLYTGGAATSDGGAPIGYRDANGSVKYFRDTATPTATTPNVSGAETTLTQPKSQADYQAEAYKSVFPEYSSAISAITDNYTKLISDAEQQGEKNQGAARAQGAAFGLMGSGDQNTQETNVAKSTASAVQNLNTARNTEIANVISKIHDNAAALAKGQAKSDLDSATNTLALRDKAQQDATASATTMAKAGITAEQLQSKDPETYQAMLSHLGGDDNLMKAIFALNKPQANVLEGKVVGSTYYQVTKDPLTGKITTEHFDLGFTPPTDYNAPVIDRTNGTAVWTPKTPDPNKPLKDQIITKQYAPSQMSALGGGGTGPVSDELKQGIANGIYDPNKINSRTLSIYNDLAKASVNASAAHADISSKTKAYEDAIRYASVAQRTTSVLDKNMPLMEGLADKVNTLGVPGIDRIVAGAQTYTGNNPDVIKYVNTIKTLRSEYANMLAKGAQVTESMRADAEEAIPTGLSSDGYKALATQLKQETSNIISAANESAKIVAPGQGNLGVSETKEANGHTYQKVQGGWKLIK